MPRSLENSKAVGIRLRSPRNGTQSPQFGTSTLQDQSPQWPTREHGEKSQKQPSYVQFLCSDWSKFDRWVHAENLCSILKLVYFDSSSWQSFVSTCDVFNYLFPLNVQSEIQLLSRVFCYLWLVCLLGFWLRNTSLWQSRKSDFGWYRFRFSPCLMRKTVEKSEAAILALLDSVQCISNGKPE